MKPAITYTSHKAKAPAGPWSAFMHYALFVIFLAPIFAGATPASAQEKESTPVGVDEVREESFKQTIPVIGRLVPRQSGIIAARTRGPVAEIRVEVGNRIEKGEVVAVLVSDRLLWEHKLSIAEVNRAKAALATTRARIDLLKQEVKRIERLSKSAAFSQARYEDKLLEITMARSSAAEAAADLERARANSKLYKIELERAEIRAPFTGVVIQRHTEAGSYLDVGNPVITLLDDLSLEIEADVPAVRIPGLTPGTPVTFRLSETSERQAVVRAVIPNENPLTRTRTVRFTPSFGNRPKNLAASQSVTLQLPAGEARQVVTVHKDAILNRNGNNLVFIVVDGSAKSRPVNLGEAVGSRFEVLAGLKPGDMVAVRGNERLRPGQKVHFLKAPGE